MEEGSHARSSALWLIDTAQGHCFVDVLLQLRVRRMKTREVRITIFFSFLPFLLLRCADRCSKKRVQNAMHAGLVTRRTGWAGVAECRSNERDIGSRTSRRDLRW